MFHHKKAGRGFQNLYTCPGIKQNNEKKVNANGRHLGIIQVTFHKGKCLIPLTCLIDTSSPFSVSLLQLVCSCGVPQVVENNASLSPHIVLK